MLNYFLATFLAIFIVTAALTLASLPGWIRIPETYRSKLFTALLLQVVGSVVGFVTAGVQLARDPMRPPALTADYLTSKPWRWHYANRNWRTDGAFIREGSQLSFSAT